MIENGYHIARNMSWDVVVSKYLLPALSRIFRTSKKNKVPAGAV